MSCEETMSFSSPVLMTFAESSPHRRRQGRWRDDIILSIIEQQWNTLLFYFTITPTIRTFRWISSPKNGADPSNSCIIPFCALLPSSAAWIRGDYDRMSGGCEKRQQNNITIPPNRGWGLWRLLKSPEWVYKVLKLCLGSNIPKLTNAGGRKTTQSNLNVNCFAIK